VKLVLYVMRREISMLIDTVGASTVIDSLIRSRRTVRAFRPAPVSRGDLVEILEVARMAPSTFNTQPWQVHLLTGAAKCELSKAILQAHAANTQPVFSPFPDPPPVACAARQNDFGRRYYGSLGIDRADRPARARQTGRNFLFFDAPVGLIFTIDAALTKHSWLDFGLFLQSLMLAAHARGLATCPQVAFVWYESVISKHLALGAEERVVCGMSLGYADEDAPVNKSLMPREPLGQFTRWLGFDE